MSVTICYQIKKALKKPKRLSRNVPLFAFESRFKVTRLYVEDSYSAQLVAEHLGVSEYSVYR